MFKLNFDFKRGEEDSVACINHALSGLMLSELHVADNNGYFRTTIEKAPAGKVKAMTYDYGFDSISLVCEQNENEEQRIYQMDVYVLGKNDEACSNYDQVWRNSHPDRVLRIMIQVDGSDMNSFIIFHHERVEHKRNDKSVKGSMLGKLFTSLLHR